MTSTIDGPQKLLDLIRNIADNEDKLNALSGTGLVLRTGIVMTSLPEITVAMDGETSLGGPMIFEQAKGDLLVPEDLFLTRGDTVVMAPLSKRRWVIMFKTRTNTDQIYRARYGINKDRDGGEFAGLEIIMDPVTGAISVNLVGGTGGTTNIGGGDVLVNGAEIVPEGIIGPPGPTGPQGPSGAQGMPGAQGPAGPTGAQGAQGNQGPAGSQGPPGTTGPAGPTGPQGATGPTGSQGAAGINGANSVAHNEYLLTTGQSAMVLPSAPYSIVMLSRAGVVQSQTDGDYTVAGSTVTLSDPVTESTRVVVDWSLFAPGTGGGDPGPAGPVGPQGATGPQGPAGATGPQGATGLTGPQGIVGPTGPMGQTGPMGPMGPIGPQGSTGSQGVMGVQGPQGVVGPQGPTGPQGSTGTGITMKGSVATVGNLPPTGNTQGDAYIVQADDSLRIWDGTKWVSGGSIQGPQGATGPQGPQGVQGLTGPQGVQGIQGATGPQGPQGVKGDKGDTGAQGPQGIQGPVGPIGPAGTGTIDIPLRQYIISIFGEMDPGGPPPIP